MSTLVCLLLCTLSVLQCILAQQPDPRIINQSQGGGGERGNQEPRLLEGGDLQGFSLFENTPVGTIVYTLRGEDPEGSRISYFISGDFFRVDRATGVVTLSEPLDREQYSSLTVVITLQDEPIRGEQENLVAFRRSIQVLDRNDNPPEFRGKPYNFTVSEIQAVGETVYAGVVIEDIDAGRNSEISIRCTEQSSTDACESFDIFAEKQEDGKYIGLVILKKGLDYERVSSYNLDLEAVDQAEGEDRLAARASILIQVEDVQDQDPVFLNSPYSANIPEDTKQDTEIFDIEVRDGDTGKPRDLDVRIEGDNLQYFQLIDLGISETGVKRLSLRTTEKRIDREQESILQEGGLYTFKIVAREITAGDEIGAETSTGVTVVITDIDDEVPVFSRQEIAVPVPEDVGADTPLPGLTLEVMDRDVSKNAKFSLYLEPVTPNSEGVFYVYPESAIGKTPVIIRVKDPQRLDHEDELAKEFIFDVVAETPSGVQVRSRVTVIVTDSNDNTPLFSESVYEFNIPEDASPETVLGTIAAEDPDSGSYGEIIYSIRGFGSEKFTVQQNSGEISVASCGPKKPRQGSKLGSCLDYETQKTFSLIFTATDGGGQLATTSLIINIEDVNDNHPKFDQSEYKRVVRVGDFKFEPPLVIKATDKDGPTQGDGRVFYAIKSINTDAVIFEIDPLTGELSMLKPASVEDTENGRYDLVIRATDQGNPEPLHADINVFINVGSTRNQRPKFKFPTYDVKLREDSNQGEVLLTVEAEDPDGEDSDLRFTIYSGSKDNFFLDPTSGVLSVSEDAVLDINENGELYELELHVTDSGEPFKQTGTAKLTINVEDVNNKPPKFMKESYTEYVLENEPSGFEVLTVTAEDPDRNAELEYDIIEPITARDKSGSVLKTVAAYDFKSAFNIDPRNGRIFLNEKLSYNSAAVIILTLQVKDKNAEIGNQTATAEATFFIQAFNADSPVFPAPWTPSDPTLEIEIDEELPPGTPLLNLSAKDPVTGQLITNYQKLQTASDMNDIIQVSQLGIVTSTQRLDFEKFKSISFSVAALAGASGEQRRSEAHITLKLKDVNDHAPRFLESFYSAKISEDVLPGTSVVTVAAVDDDAGEMGSIVYSLEGEGTEQFTINPTDGHITVKAGERGRSNLDREVQAEYSLKVVARDLPEGGADQKSTAVLVQVSLLDVNDSPPQFVQSRYTAVVPENSPVQTLVVQVSAVDPDVGVNSEVTYDFANPSQIQDLYSIDKKTGRVYTRGTLTGRGRREPYIITIRAVDGGSPIQQFKDTDLYITIGDVSRNDGVPEFQRPAVGDVAEVFEEAPVGTFVFQCEASDRDDPNTANGKLVYSFPEDGSIIHQLFNINPNTGLISTISALDRETRAEYSLTIEVRDLGTPVQQATRTLSVIVKDIDDHPPQFHRQRNSVPLAMEVLEEMELGNKIGIVSAVDEDEDRNAEIDYAIIDGDKDEIFGIERDEENNGLIFVNKRLDREKAGLYTLTIRCFKPGDKGLLSQRKKYDKTKLDEIQVKIFVLDQDDNNPQFSKNNITLGVRVNSPLYTELTQLTAIDPDPAANPVVYSIQNVSYFNPKSKYKKLNILDGVFIVDPTTGVLQTNRTYGKYSEGYFDLTVKASNTPDPERADYAHLKIFVLQDTDLMKFVFDDDPVQVSKHISEIKSDLEAAFTLPLSINIYDTEFYSKYDGSLDFGRTSSCFQVLKDNDAIQLNSVQTLFDTTSNPGLKEKLDKYRVISVERCASVRSTYKMSWVQICILVIALLIGVVAFIAAIVLSCLYSTYRRRIRRNNIRIVEAPVRALIPASLPPGSVLGPRPPSAAGSNGRIYEWQETALPIDTVSYRSLPR